MPVLLFGFLNQHVRQPAMLTQFVHSLTRELQRAARVAGVMPSLLQEGSVKLLVSITIKYGLHRRSINGLYQPLRFVAQLMH
jgi:hypothetical protein